MRLAFVIHHYFPYGGLQRDAMRIAKACQKRGHQIDFLTMQWKGARDAAMPVRFFPQTSMFNYQRYYRFEKDVLAYIKRHSYDRIVGFNKMAGLDFYYAGDLCYAAVLNEKPWNQYYRWLPRYQYLLKAEQAVAGLQSQTQLLLMNQKAHADFAHYYSTPDSRMHILPPGISTDRCWRSDAPLVRQAMRERLGIRAHEKIILMLGSSFNTKGVDRGIRALAALPDALKPQSYLFIVGQGKPDTFLQLAKKLHVSDRVKFLSGSSEVPAFLFAADLLLHPAYRENAGMAILESMVAGLPVLTTANCGYAHYVEAAQAGCVLAMPFQQEQLNALLALMLSASEIEQWKENGIRFGIEADIYSLPDRAASIILEGKEK